MATSTQLAQRLSVLFAARISTCTNTYKQLQAGNIVSRSGRGRNASHVTARDCVMLVLALIGSEHINDAADAARRYSTLEAKYRTAKGAYADHQDDTQWHAMKIFFPALGSLAARHDLADAMTAIVDSYADGSVKPLAAGLTILVTIRGPSVSALISMANLKGSEVLEYSTVNAGDMFRTVIGNPNHPDQPATGKVYLSVQKTITAETLEALGTLLREAKA